MEDYKSLHGFTPRMKEKILAAWEGDRLVFWKYGTIRPRGGDIVVCLRGGVVRDRISGEDIAEELVRREEGVASLQ